MKTERVAKKERDIIKNIIMNVDDEGKKECKAHAVQGKMGLCMLSVDDMRRIAGGRLWKFGPAGAG